MTKPGNRQTAQTRQPTPAPLIECHGCGALHALIDRLTEAAERLERITPQPETCDELATPSGWHPNPYGIPDEPHQK